jgi:hypothetical protein
MSDGRALNKATKTTKPINALHMKYQLFFKFRELRLVKTYSDNMSLLAASKFSEAASVILALLAPRGPIAPQSTMYIF